MRQAREERQPEPGRQAACLEGRWAGEFVKLIVTQSTKLHTDQRRHDSYPYRCSHSFILTKARHENTADYCNLTYALLRRNQNCKVRRHNRMNWQTLR